MPPACLFIIFGASGDLARRKLLPAIYQLVENERVETLYVLGVARTGYSDEDFRKEMREALREHADLPDVTERWCSSCLYYLSLKGDGSDYEALKRRIEEIEATHDLPGNRVFYLSVPPTVFPATVEELGRHGLNQSEGWTRIVVEKPFGHDLDSAKELNALIHRHFDESQVYRIDHYLGKETVRNLLVFRFANVLFESLWHRDRIERVEIQVKESDGVGSRAGYYDESGGALRDMIQNHLTQLFTLVAMEPPARFDAEHIRQEKVKVLDAVQPLDPADVRFGQYAAGEVAGEPVKGYLEEKGVPADSTTETYAAVTLRLANWRWQGVPFVLETGKRLPKRVTRIVVHFRRAPVALFQNEQTLCDIRPNLLVITLQPDEGFDLHFEVKAPGEQLQVVTQKLDFRYAEAFDRRIPEAYETLLLDVIQGDQTLFVHADETEAAWRLYTPLLSEHPQVAPYSAGSEGPEREQ